MQKNAKQKIKGKGMIIYHIKGTKKKWKQKTKKVFERERYYSNCASSNYCSIADFGRSKLKCNILVKME